MSQSPDKTAPSTLAPAASTSLTSPWTLRGTQTIALGFLLGKHPPEVHPEIKKIQVRRPLGMAQGPAVRGSGKRMLRPACEAGKPCPHPGAGGWVPPRRSQQMARKELVSQ